MTLTRMLFVASTCLVLFGALGCSLITNVDRNDIEEGEGGSAGAAGESAGSEAGSGGAAG